MRRNSFLHIQKVLLFPMSFLLGRAAGLPRSNAVVCSSRMASRAWHIPLILREVRGPCRLRMDLSFGNNPKSSTAQVKEHRGQLIRIRVPGSGR